MMSIARLSELDLNGTYTYVDYLTWQFEERLELIKGKIMLMSPAPNVNHQRISLRLSGIFYHAFKGQSCQVFAAPFDVRLYSRKKSVPANRDGIETYSPGRAPTVGALGDAGVVVEDIYTVVQPDLCVICDTNKLDTQGCLGAPDWIIEILSKGNTKREMRIKYELYQESGVKEYWLVYPYEQAVYQFVLSDGQEKYQLFKMYCGDDIATPFLFPDLKIDLKEVFLE